MRCMVGILLILFGGSIMLAGIVMALLTLGRLYQGVLESPLDQPEGAEDAARLGMLRWAGLGAIGIPPFLVGGALLKGELARRFTRARSETRPRRH